MSNLSAPSQSAPVNVSRALERVVRILRDHYRLFLQLGSIPAAALVLSIAGIFGTMYAFGLFPQHGELDPRRFVWVFIPLTVVCMVPMMLAFAWFEAAACTATLAIESGRECTFSSAFAEGWRRLGKLVWLMFLRYLYVALPAMVMGILGGAILLAMPAGRKDLFPPQILWLVPLAIPCYLGAAVYAVWMTLRLCLALPACMAEEQTARGALDRSVQLTLGSKGRILLVLLVVYAVGYAGMLLVQLGGMTLTAIGSLLALLAGIHPRQPIALALMAAPSLVVFALFLAMMVLSWSSYSITFAVLYADRRQQRESAIQPVTGGGPV